MADAEYLRACRSHVAAVSATPPEIIPPLPSGRLIEEIRRSTNFQMHELSGTGVRATLSLRGGRACAASEDEVRERLAQGKLVEDPLAELRAEPAPAARAARADATSTAHFGCIHPLGQHCALDRSQ